MTEPVLVCPRCGRTLPRDRFAYYTFLGGYAKPRIYYKDRGRKMKAEDEQIDQYDS